MTVLLIILGLIFMAAGLIGCFLPIIPGPPLSYLGLLFLHWSSKYQFSSEFLLIMAAVAIGATVLDNFIPALSAKRSGASKRAVWGSVAGLIIGMFFFPPLGLIVGPFLGAVLGELSMGENSNDALKSGFNTFLGFLGGVLIKLIASGVMLYYFLQMAFFS